MEIQIILMPAPMIAEETGAGMDSCSLAQSSAMMGILQVVMAVQQHAYWKELQLQDKDLLQDQSVVMETRKVLKSVMMETLPMMTVVQTPATSPEEWLHWF